LKTKCKKHIKQNDRFANNCKLLEERGTDIERENNNSSLICYCETKVEWAKIQSDAQEISEMDLHRSRLVFERDESRELERGR
jgi:hypothetical protein